MRFAAIADIHGNCLALEAVLADMAAIGVTEVVNLGDHVSGPLEPRRTADLLISRDFVSIRGDQDRRLVELGAPGGSQRWDHAQLDRSHLDWLAGQPPTLLYRDDVLLCHGSPTSDAAYWLDRVTADGAIQASPIADIEADAADVAASLICARTRIFLAWCGSGTAVSSSIPAASAVRDMMAASRSITRCRRERPMPATPSSRVHRRGGA